MCGQVHMWEVDLCVVSAYVGRGPVCGQVHMWEGDLCVVSATGV